jgi:hypothetical protein
MAELLITFVATAASKAAAAARKVKHNKEKVEYLVVLMQMTNVNIKVC